MRTQRLTWTGAALLVLCPAFAAFAWWGDTHVEVALAAAKALPDDVPAFFRQGGIVIAAYSNDPDLYRDRALPALSNAGRPEHFLDIELLQGRDLPRTRGDYLALCNELRIHPFKPGFLPYAIQEEYEKLVYAFAEHRRWPTDERLCAKILYIAGILSHYTADATQPLHCTVHYDGLVGADGASPRSGIHNKVDALPGRLRLRATGLRIPPNIRPAEDAFALIVKTIRDSNALVPQTYQMEPLLPPAEGPMPAAVDAQVRSFALERASAAVEFTATIWYTAWGRSKDIVLPAHHPYFQTQ